MAASELHVPRPMRSQAPQSGDWTSTLGILPSALNLFSPRALGRHGLRLASNASNVPVIVKPNQEPRDNRPTRELTRPQRRWLGQVALEVYFRQIFRSEAALVDLWPSRFGVDVAGDAVWHPRPIFARWDPFFVQALRAVYVGFFLGDEEYFDAGLHRIGLGAAAKLLLGHLGEGNQRSVRFRTEELKSTIRSVSALRRPEDAALHDNFITLGLLLGALHRLLESLESSFNVRSAFMRSYPGS